MLTQLEIDEAAARLRPHVRRTPVITARAGTIEIAFKLEFLQHSGSFKARGAFNRLLTATPRPAGVVAASGGNHGAAVAYAARELGIEATIFVPEPTPAAKLARIAEYGAEVVRQGTAYADALEASRVFQATSGALEVHAYDDAAVLAGQGTVGREFAEDAPGLTHVLVAVGGGGLIGGIAAWYAGTGTTVVGVEPETCAAWHAAKQAGAPTPVPVSGLAADSLGARQVGVLMFGIALASGVESVLVTDPDIAAAQHHLWSELRIVAEPGGAAALAALLSGAWTPPPGARVGVLLCGANTDPALVSRGTA